MLLKPVENFLGIRKAHVFNALHRCDGKPTLPLASALNGPVSAGACDAAEDEPPFSGQ